MPFTGSCIRSVFPIVKNAHKRKPRPVDKFHATNANGKDAIKVPWMSFIAKPMIHGVPHLGCITPLTVISFVDPLTVISFVDFGPQVFN